MAMTPRLRRVLAVATAAVLGSLAQAVEPAPVAASADPCACVSGRMTTDADVRRCQPMLARLTPEETVALKGRCEAASAPAAGPDLCFCLTRLHTDPRIVAACEALVGKNTPPSALARLGAKCR